MKHVVSILLIFVSCFLCSSFAQGSSQCVNVGDASSFANLLQQHQDKIFAMLQRQRDAKKLNTAAAKKELSAACRAAYRDLFKQFPICYDWWLQDATSPDGIKDTALREMLLAHLKKVGEVVEPSLPLTEMMEKYLQACVKRRAERLAASCSDSRQIVFTKFKPLTPSFFAYTEGLSDARDECNYNPGGALGVLHMEGIWGREEILLSDEDGVFRDPDIHCNGNDILFSWKKSAKQDDFHLYEYDYSKKSVRQLTEGLGFADIEPLYLPDNNIMFNSTRCGNSVDCWKVEVSNLYLCDRDGQYMRRIGFDQVHTSNPALLADGRVVYTRWDYSDRAQLYTQPLFQMNPDGTGQSEYYGLNSYFPTTLTHVAPIPNSRKLMAIATGHHTPQHGKLVRIDIEAGRQETQGVTMLAPLQTPKHQKVDKYGTYGDQFQYPCPLSEQECFISYSPLGYDVGYPMNFGLYWMDENGNRELLLYDHTTSCNQPCLLEKKAPAFQRASHVDYRNKSGIYYMQNIYAGDALKGVALGTVKKLRVVELVYRAASIGAAFGEGKGGRGHAFSPVGVGNSSWDIKRIHGTVDVEADGSALFRVPSRTPLYFQALDDQNRMVQSMRSWSTLQGGEMQSCVGCHEHKNSVPLAQLSSTLAMQKPVQDIQAEHTGNRCFDYQKELQPIWDQHCIQCHDGKTQQFNLKGDLISVDTQTKRFFSHSYLALTHARKTSKGNDSWQGDADHKEINWISALSEPTLLKPYHAGSNCSNLIKRLEKGHGGCKLSAEEIEIIALWMDLGVPFISDYKQAANWSDKEHRFYDYYEKKRQYAQQEEKKAIETYIKQLQP